MARPLHSCVVCVYKRMLKHGQSWWQHAGDFEVAPVCERHEPEALLHFEHVSRGYELYPQGVDT